MVVYVEYAFVWNFLLDGVLLWLSLRACKREVKRWRLCVSAFVGAAFAIVFPLLSLPDILANGLKFSVGFLLCLIAFGRVKNKKEGGKYALTCTFFFSFTFAFGGGILAVSGEGVHKGIILLSFAVLTVISLILIEKMYAKKAVEKNVYPCAIAYKQRRVSLLGFYDSGNLATEKGVPVCFVSVDVFYDLWGEEMVFGNGETGGQVCVEIPIVTMHGEKKMKGCLGMVEIALKEGRKLEKQVYFCPSANMLRREYKLLLNARIFDGE